MHFEDYVHFEEFFHIAESVTQIMYAWRFIPRKKSFQFGLVNWIGRINFIRLNISHFDIVQILRVFNFLFPKTIGYELGTVGTFRALRWYTSNLVQI